MGANQPIPTIPLINEINHDTDSAHKNRKAQETARNEREHDKLKIREEKYNPKDPEKKLFDRTLMYKKKNSKLFENGVLENNSSNEKEENENENESEKPIMITKEERNILQTFLKKNAFENKKPIAKNLEKLYLKRNSSNINQKHINSQNKKSDRKKNIQKTRNSIKKLGPAEGKVRKSIASKTSPKSSIDIKKNIKRNSTGDMVVLSKSKENKNAFTNYVLNDIKNTPSLSNNNIDKNIINPKRNSIQTSQYQNNTFNSKKKNKDKSDSKENSPIKEEDISENLKISQQNFDKTKVFKRKSFRNYIENINNTTYDYNECLKFINSTQVLSHLNEFQKSILSESLQLEQFSEKTFIVKANKKASTMYFLKKGTVKCLDEDNKCVRILTAVDNFGERAILVNSRRTMSIETITECICYSINVKTLKKMFGENFRSYLYLNFMKSAFYSSKKFHHVDNYIIEKIFQFFEAINLGNDNVAYPIGHIKSSKIIILVSGDLVNSKTGEIIGKSGDILFEDELLSLSDEKINYALNPCPDALFLEGDTHKILNFLNCKNFSEIVDKVGICDNLGQVALFKSLSKSKLTMLINLINIEKYKDKDIIIKEGTIGNKFYIVKSGNVEVYSKEKYLRTLNETEYFGERSLLTNELRSATILAKGNVELYSLDKESFLVNLSPMMKDYLHKRLYLHDETVSLNDLIFLKSLGKGNYGSVSLVMNTKTNFPYAIKAISKDHIKYEDLMKNIQLEKQILLKIDHPFIVKSVKCLKDDINIYILLEYIKGKELFDVIRDIGLLNKKQTNFYIASMFVAINYLHERKIIYRDIKPENIIVTSKGYLKLVDFGTAKEIKEKERTSTIIGTPHYMAPEIILGRGYSFQVDYWSISICMYEFICGGVPFGESLEDPIDIYFSVMNQKLSFPPCCINDNNFKLLMKEMLEKNPSCRLTSFESIKAHNWFKNFNWDELCNLNLDPPYKPILLKNKYDFNDRCEPCFNVSSNQFKSYKDYIKENANEYQINTHFELPSDKMEEYNDWLENF